MFSRLITGITFLFLFASSLHSQDPGIQNLRAESLRNIPKTVNDSLPKNWQIGGVYHISAGQGSLSNWAAGGDDFSFSVTTSINLFGFYQKGKTSWDNVINATFGYMHTSSLGGRKNDDRLDIVSKYGYSLHSKLNLTTLTNFRSQLLNGYNYPENAKGSFGRQLSSAFLSPAYLLISQGLDINPGKDYRSLFPR
jgi:hypothetical protein